VSQRPGAGARGSNYQLLRVKTKIAITNHYRGTVEYANVRKKLEFLLFTASGHEDYFGCNFFSFIMPSQFHSWLHSAATMSHM
jgi:hypothetical protein